MALTNATTSGKLQKTENLTVRTSPVFRVQEEPGVKISKTWYRRIVCHQTVAKHGLRMFILTPDLR